MLLLLFSEKKVKIETDSVQYSTLHGSLELSAAHTAALFTSVSDTSK